tara:strand:- start:3986 stop:4177 length:192 start_codon:yes stop_codon:yes gene_type:complete
MNTKDLSLDEIIELLRKEIDIYNATTWRTNVKDISNDDRSWYDSSVAERTEFYLSNASLMNKY